MKVTLAYSPTPRRVQEWTLVVAAGCSVGQAIQHSSLLSEHVDLTFDNLTLGVWGKRCGLAHQLNENDRIEVYRALRVDPKVARRERFTRQGAKNAGAGLFANKRPGAKAGYGG